MGRAITTPASTSSLCRGEHGLSWSMLLRCWLLVSVFVRGIAMAVFVALVYRCEDTFLHDYGRTMTVGWLCCLNADSIALATAYTCRRRSYLLFLRRGVLVSHGGVFLYCFCGLFVHRSSWHAFMVGCVMWLSFITWTSPLLWVTDKGSIVFGAHFLFFHIHAFVYEAHLGYWRASSSLLSVEG